MKYYTQTQHIVFVSYRFVSHVSYVCWGCDWICVWEEVYSICIEIKGKKFYIFFPIFLRLSARVVVVVVMLLLLLLLSVYIIHTYVIHTFFIQYTYSSNVNIFCMMPIGTIRYDMYIFKWFLKGWIFWKIWLWLKMMEIKNERIKIYATYMTTTTRRRMTTTTTPTMMMTALLK